jgi:N-acetylmuramoyl-L-alanine amidase
MTILIYLIKTVLISGLLFGYFWLFLRNRSFHRFNRIFLISIPVLSLLLPSLHFNLPGFWNSSAGGSPIRLLGVGQGSLEEAVTVYATKTSGNIFSLPFISLLITLFISSFLLTRFIKTIRFLLDLRKDKIFMELPEATVYFVSEEGTPFSFFKFVFWGEETEINSPAGRQILRHELFHVKKNHSLDIVGMEIISILLWFNPFIHLIIRELKVIHEYEADEYAMTGTDEYEYASLLLMKISGSPLPLTNPFFKNQIKRRIAMITKSNKNKKAVMGRLMILPLIALLICLFSFKMNKHLLFHSQKTIKVVIDAGHGGIFTGAQSAGIFEKNINLNIAKKIQSLSKEYNVEVIMTRETDVTPGSNELKESLEYIVALPKNKNADLFISIHANSTQEGTEGKSQTSKSGFQIYIPRNSSEVYEGSLKFGSVLSEVIKSDYAIEPELKQTRGDGGNILILRKATVPALLIECGYMDNPSDLKYLLDEKNQEKIARDILDGIKKYGMQEKVISYNPLSPTTPALENAESKELTSAELRQNNGDSSVPLRKVEVEASYPGGEEGWKKYLLKTLTYPKEAEKNETQGQVIVEFVVNEDGSLTNVHAISGPKVLRSGSVKVVAESGKWVPALNNGLVVESYKKQPINYKLSVQ